MPSDIGIVEWLRAEAELVALPRLNEAAAEIERLRLENEQLASRGNFLRHTLDLQGTAVREYQELIIELRAENERLKNAGSPAPQHPRACA